VLKKTHFTSLGDGVTGCPGERKARKKMSKKEKHMEKKKKKQQQLEALYDFNEMDWEANLEGASKLLFDSDIPSDSSGVSVTESGQEEEGLSDSDVEMIEKGDAKSKSGQTAAAATAATTALETAVAAVSHAQGQASSVDSGEETGATGAAAASASATTPMDTVDSDGDNAYLAKLKINTLEYEAVSRVGRDSLKGIRADGGQVAVQDVGTFASTADGRLMRVGLKCSLPDKKNVTMSFDPVSMECHGCPIHHAKQMWRPKGSREVANLQGEAFLLTDQAYPPLFPVEKQNCMKIIRREHGSVMELASELLAVTKGMEVGKQTVVLIHSLSHMARAGTEGYIEELLMAGSKIKAVLGQHVAVIPLPHLFEAGCKSEMAIRTVAEVTTWASRVYGNDGLYLGRSFEIANKLLAPKMGAEAQVDYERTLWLPTTTKWPATKATWVMGGFKLAKAIEPVSVAMEATLILSLIEELRKGLALELDVDPTFDLYRQWWLVTSLRWTTW
jgi:hypothetical protein